MDALEEVRVVRLEGSRSRIQTGQAGDLVLWRQPGASTQATGSHWRRRRCSLNRGRSQPWWARLGRPHLSL